MKRLRVFDLPARRMPCPRGRSNPGRTARPQDSIGRPKTGTNRVPLANGELVTESQDLGLRRSSGATGRPPGSDGRRASGPEAKKLPGRRSVSRPSRSRSAAFDHLRCSIFFVFTVVPSVRRLKYMPFATRLPRSSRPRQVASYRPAGITPDTSVTTRRPAMS